MAGGHITLFLSDQYAGRYKIPLFEDCALSSSILRHFPYLKAFAPRIPSRLHLRAQPRRDWVTGGGVRVKGGTLGWKGWEWMGLSTERRPT